MTKRVVGFVGDGNAIQHFLSAQGAAPLVHKKRQILTQADGVVFYNYSFNSNTDYAAKKLASISPYLSSLGLKHKIEDGYGPKDSFAEFIGQSDVVIDATRGYRFPSLHNLAAQLKQGRDFNQCTPPKEKIQEDFTLYRARAHHELRKQMSLTEFAQRWELSFEIMQIAASVNTNFRIGWRILDELPFNAPVFVERGTQLQKILVQGASPPTYINIANEPCITSTLMAGNCSAITSYLVACTGFDVERLHRVFDETNLYKGIMRRCNINPSDLSISLRGFHDQEVMVPVVGSREPHAQTLQSLIDAGLSYETMYQHLRREVGAYWNNYNLDSGQREKRDVNEEIDNNLLDLIHNALQSKGKALSLFPSKNERPLCNGFFHQLDQTGSGFFMLGNHRFRNGKVMADE